MKLLLSANTGTHTATVVLLCSYLVMSSWTLGNNFHYTQTEAYLIVSCHSICLYIFCLLTGISQIELGQECIDRAHQRLPVEDRASTSETKLVTWNNYFTVPRGCCCCNLERFTVVRNEVMFIPLYSHIHNQYNMNFVGETCCFKKSIVGQNEVHNLQWF
jgi:hypothetical protein